MNVFGLRVEHDDVFIVASSYKKAYVVYAQKMGSSRLDRLYLGCYYTGYVNFSSRLINEL